MPPGKLKKTVRPPLEKFSGCTHEGEVTGCEGPWFNSMHNESMTDGHGNRALPCLSTLGSAGLSSRLLLLFSSRLWDRTGSATTDNGQWKHGPQTLWQKHLCTSDQQYMRTKYIHDHSMLKYFFLSWKWNFIQTQFESDGEIHCIGFFIYLESNYMYWLKLGYFIWFKINNMSRFK